MSQICIISKQLKNFTLWLFRYNISVLLLARNYRKSFKLACGRRTNLTCYKALIAGNSDKKCTCRLEVATQNDCLEERVCFASTWFLYRLLIASELMPSQRTFFWLLDFATMCPIT